MIRPCGAANPDRDARRSPAANIEASISAEPPSHRPSRPRDSPQASVGREIARACTNFTQEPAKFHAIVKHELMHRAAYAAGVCVLVWTSVELWSPKR
jgi:hypothetical protein